MLSAAPPLVASRRASPASPSANVVLRTTQREARLCATSRQRSRSPPGDAGEARRVAQRSGEGACNAPRKRPLRRRRRSRRGAELVARVRDSPTNHGLGTLELHWHSVPTSSVLAQCHPPPAGPV